eukprot:187527-Chlamydomonas_euryale.AAC.1
MPISANANMARQSPPMTLRAAAVEQRVGSLDRPRSLGVAGREVADTRHDIRSGYPDIQIFGFGGHPQLHNPSDKQVQPKAATRKDAARSCTIQSSTLDCLSQTPPMHATQSHESNFYFGVPESDVSAVARREAAAAHAAAAAAAGEWCSGRGAVQRRVNGAGAGEWCGGG